MKDINFQETVKKFQELVKKIVHYNEAAGLLGWDLRTGAPQKAVVGRAQVLGTISGEAFKMTVSEEMQELLNVLAEPKVYEELDDVTKATVREVKIEFDRYKKIPFEKLKEYIILTSQAQSVWEKAKEERDFSLFQPYLEKIVAYKREVVELWGYEGHKYNALLDLYEPGITVEKLDQVFDFLKKNIIPLLENIKEYGKTPNEKVFLQHFPREKQKKLCLLLLEKIGYDFSRGRLDESEHPFTIKLNLGDVRVTTHFYENDLRSALFSTIHEGGHALYEQSISDRLNDTPLCRGASMGIHESQSRYWENVIGRSLPFWNQFMNEVMKVFPREFEGVSSEEMYSGVNIVCPSLIRVEADELTYSLHIILRYEIEKALINGDVEVKELPELWNSKMQEYLGILPSHDGEGVLQDVHWSGGAFGYFPSYALGNIYALQFENTMRKEIVNYDEKLEKGEYEPIKKWLQEKIYQHGKLFKPDELVKRVTTEEINPEYFFHYLKKKYSKIYNL